MPQSASLAFAADRDTVGATVHPEAPVPSEQERLRQLRDRQLAARDPQSGQRRMHREISVKQRRSVESFSLGRIWREVPWFWKGGAIGFGMGALIVALLPLVWVSPWTLPCAGFALLFFTILGLVIGRAFDTRDSLRDLVR